jgi:exosortase J
MSATTSPRLVPEIGNSPATENSMTRASRALPLEQLNASTHAPLWMWIGLLTIAGFWGVAPTLAKLWDIWTTDPLRSIGIVIFPTSVVLVLRVWRQNGWELKGTWWGLLPVSLAFVPAVFSERPFLSWSAGSIEVSFLPYALPIYLYASGIILLVAGVRVWRRAWFPLALLLFLQPVPQVLVQFLDIPLQSLSAHMARSFAALLGLSPANTDLLRLMFTPSFGMFIAPGCDGLRGAITMAYGAMIACYVKQISISRWIMYVAGAFFLGHVLNLFRLCALVAYYKIAIGHFALERLAKQADYVIGGTLFLVAAFLCLWLLSKETNDADAVRVTPQHGKYLNDRGPTYWRTAALALLIIAASLAGVRVDNGGPKGLAQELRRGEVTVKDLHERIPPQLDNYRLARDWQEYVDGSPALEIAAYQAANGNEIEIGLWLIPNFHSVQLSLMTHGESPKIKAIERIATAGGKPVLFNTALYNDGVTDSLVGDTYCNSSSCDALKDNADGIHFGITRVMNHSTPSKRFVPIFFKIQVPHDGAPDQAVYAQLLSECQSFLSHVDFIQLGQRFQ